MPFRPVSAAIRLGSIALRYRTPLAQSTTLPAPRRRRHVDRVAVTKPDPAESEYKLQCLEAVLFLAREPLNSRKLSQYAGLNDGTEARTLIRQLNKRFDDQGRAFRVEEVGGGFQLLTREAFARWLRRLPHIPSAVRLSTPAMETLAVVSYRQPVLRAEIEAIRGVSCGEILRQLMERDLVKIGGRSDELGRPYLYATTSRFLQMFGLKNVQDLPRADWVRNPLPEEEEVLAAEEEIEDEEETEEEEEDDEEEFEDEEEVDDEDDSK